MMAKYGFVRAIVIAGVCLVGGMSASAALAQTVKVHVSSHGGDRLTAKPDVQFSESEDAGGASSQVNGHGNAHDKVRGHAQVDPQVNTFQVNDAVRYQKMDGFGASIMEAGLMTLNTLPEDKQEEVLRALFDAKDGAGFTAMKTPLAGTDFQSAGPWFTYDDIPGDVELRNFSVERDFAPNGVGTYILRARKYGHFALQAPMDYPPDWMLYDVKK
ncbi:MAG: hypothetical protein DMG34_17500, partial [Acidobacteria bacterium]